MTKTLNKASRYRAVIVGAGRIGANFDTPDSANILTHAHAYRAHLSTELVGFFDVDRKMAQAAARKWNVAAFANLTEMLATVKPDIVSVCSPTATHFSVLNEIAEAGFKPRLVIVEKPVAETSAQIKKIKNKFSKLNIPLSVNYSRRFDAVARQVWSDIKNKKYGNVISAVGLYNKGLIHAGSHLLDLAGLFFGRVSSGKTLHKIYDHSKSDPSVSAWLKFTHCPNFFLIAGDSRAYEIFEMEILLEKARLKFFNAGQELSVELRVKDKLCPEFTVLGKPVIKKTELARCAYGLIQNAVDFLDKKAELYCALDDALKAQAICEKLILN